MNRVNRWFDLGSVAALGAAVVATAIVYGELPARVPTHFGLTGHADDWTRREIGAWLIPAIAAIAWAAARFAASWSPGAWRSRAARSPMAAAAFLVTALLAGTQGTILWASFHPGESIGRALAMMLGGFMIALSLVLPRIRRNAIVGIRVPWTLASDENWARTHRFGSYVFSVCGAIALLGVVFDGSAAGAIAIVAILCGAGASIVFSYVVARGEPEN